MNVSNYNVRNVDNYRSVARGPTLCVRTFVPSTKELWNAARRTTLFARSFIPSAKELMDIVRIITLFAKYFVPSAKELRSTGRRTTLFIDLVYHLLKSRGILLEEQH